MLILLTILAQTISAALYRIPRGGPSGEVWLRWTNGLFGGSSFLGALVWALVTAGMLVGIAMATTGLSWTVSVVAFLVLSVWLMLGETQMGDWADYGPHTSQPNLLKMQLRGLLLLQPLRGVTYFWCYKNDHRLPRLGQFFDGWGGWAEFLVGLQTYAGFTLLGALILFLI